MTIEELEKPALDARERVVRTRLAVSSSGHDARIAAVWVNAPDFATASHATAPGEKRSRIRVAGPDLRSDIVVEGRELHFDETRRTADLTPEVGAATWLKDALGLSMTQLAELASVTRAGAYAWFKGASRPNAARADNLIAMHDALAGFNQATLRFLPQIWESPGKGGVTLYALLQALDGSEAGLQQVRATVDSLVPRLKKLIERGERSENNQSGHGISSAVNADIFRDLGRRQD
jgi:transcriptional regulator with XRE-family HTH domain